MTVFVAEVSADGKRPIPKPLTMEEKVKGSDLIFIGETTRVFFADERGEELEVDPENPLYVGSWLRVKIKQVLWKSDSGKAFDGELTINYPTDGSAGSKLRERYLGKDWIYFVRVVRSRWNVSGRTEIRELLRFAPGRWLVYPHSLDQLDDLMAAISALRVEGLPEQRIK